MEGFTQIGVAAGGGLVYVLDEDVHRIPPGRLMLGFFLLTEEGATSPVRAGIPITPTADIVAMQVTRVDQP